MSGRRPRTPGTAAPARPATPASSWRQSPGGSVSAELNDRWRAARRRLEPSPGEGPWTSQEREPGPDREPELEAAG